MSITTETPAPGTEELEIVEQRREQLIDAAIAVLAEEGLQRTTTRRITDRAGLALGAFHYAFRSKDELLAAVMCRLIAGAEHDLRRALEDRRTAVEGPEQALAHTGRALWREAERAPHLQLAQRELAIHALRTPALRRLAAEQYARYASSIAELLDRAGVGLDHQRRTDLARYLVAGVDGLALQHLVDGDAAASERRLELFLGELTALVPVRR